MTVEIHGDGTITGLRTTGGALPAGVAGEPYAFHVTRGGGTTIPNGVITKMPFNVEEYDAGSVYDASTNFRFTAPVSGIFHFDLAVQFAESLSAGTFAAVYIYKNGVISKGAGCRVQGNSDDMVVMSADVKLAAGDYVEAYAYQGSGASKTTNSLAYYTYFCGHLVRAGSF